MHVFYTEHLAWYKDLPQKKLLQNSCSWQFTVGFLSGCVLTLGSAWSAPTLSLVLLTKNPFSLSQGMLHQEIWKTSSFRVVVGIVAPNLSGTRWHQVPISLVAISVVAGFFGTLSPTARALKTPVTSWPAAQALTQGGLSLLVSA